MQNKELKKTSSSGGLIEIKDLTYTYNPKSPFETRALDKVSLTIERGDFFGIIGQTGSGKSTLISHINALTRVQLKGKVNDCATVNVCGIDLTAKKPDLKRLREKVGMVFQYPEYQLFADTVREDVAFGPKNLGIGDAETDERVREAIRLVGLNYTEISERNFSWSPSAYITTQDALEEGQTYVLLSECIVPGKNIPIEAEKGVILSPSDFSDDVNLLFTAQNFTTAQISPNMKAYQGEHIVLSFLQNKIKICKCSFDEPFFVNQNQVAFALKEDSPVSLDYLVYTLLNSRSFKNLSSLMNGLHARVTRQITQYILECNVAIDADKNKQHAIINSLKQQYTQRKRTEMQAEMARLGIRDASSDLSHILGASFDKISNTLASIQSEPISEDLMTSLHVISDNFMYIRRMINAVGADFSKARSQIRDVELNAFINNYVSSWRNYGSSIFNLAYNSEVSDDTVLRIDEDMFRVLLDAILRNAYRHGFENKKSSDNQVLINTSFSKINDTEYVLITIANNGNPFPEGFTLKDYVTRGSIAGKMGNTGLGGYHVWSIVERHNGHMNISCSKTWNAIIEILIPVEIYAESDANKFIEYGGSEYL